jgi:hypothetical protein
MKNLIRPYLFGLLVILGLFVTSGAQTDSTQTAPGDSLPKLTQAQARRLLLQSAIIPGWGERSLNILNECYGFNASEIVLWVTYLTLEWYGSATADDMKAYAAAHAGVNPSGKDEYYFNDIGNYEIFIHTTLKNTRSFGRFIVSLTVDYYWAWDSDASRKYFDKLRVRSATALRNASFAVGGLVANRLVSMLDIMVLTRNGSSSRLMILNLP